MDKVKINNQVVKMRKHVKRAKLFAINKFTKQLKQLQLKKGIDSQIEKNQRKSERLLEKVKILKKMVPDFVSKKALSKAQDWNAVLAQKNVLLEDQCLALLANDNEVQKDVNRFYAEECQLAEKIPSLLLEWEIKKSMPKSPDQDKKASDIKRQKLDKIAKRKRSNFKGATFPNNVAVDKKMKPADCNKKKRQKISDIPQEKNKDGNFEPVLDESKESDLKPESFNDSDASESGELFSKTTKNSKKRRMDFSGEDGNFEPVLDDSKESDDLESESFDDSDASESGELFSKISKNSKRRKMDISEEEELDSESTLDGERQEFFIKPVSKEQTKNNASSAQMTEESSTPVDSSCEEENIDSDDVSNSSFPKLKTNKNSETRTQPSIFERLSAIASQDTKKLKFKSAKSNSSSQNTKAIEVLDLSKLHDSDQISIQSIPVDSQGPDTLQTTFPKKDSFFLNGGQEVESSEDESNVNNYRDFKTKSNFSGRGGRFKRNSFDDRSSSNFKDKRFNKNENKSLNKKNLTQNINNKYQSRKGKDFHQDENRFKTNSFDDRPSSNFREKRFNKNENKFLNKKNFKQGINNKYQSRKDFHQDESRFQKNVKRNSLLNDRKSEGHHPKHSEPSKVNDSLHLKRENKKNSNSFQSKMKQSNEKGEEKSVELHPSWKAKSKLKEAAKSGFKGKRVVFD